MRLVRVRAGGNVASPYATVCVPHCKLRKNALFRWLMKNSQQHVKSLPLHLTASQRVLQTDEKESGARYVKTLCWKKQEIAYAFFGRWKWTTLKKTKGLLRREVDHRCLCWRQVSLRLSLIYNARQRVVGVTIVVPGCEYTSFPNRQTSESWNHESARSCRLS